MNQKPSDETYSAEETARRRDEALRRALSTPPKPQKNVSPKQRESKKRKAAKPSS
jgi:hypothetical protein